MCAVVPCGFGASMRDTGRDSGDVTLSAVPRLGCGSLDYRQQAQQIELKTGGMSAAPQVLPDDSQLDTYEQVGPARRGAAVAGGLRGACPRRVALCGWRRTSGLCLCCCRVCCFPRFAWTGTSPT